MQNGRLVKSVAPGLALLLAGGCASADATAQLQLEPCDDYGQPAMCGWQSVPENRADPESRVIDVRVVVIPAESDSGREPVLLFPGGPGQATTGLVGLAGAYPEISATRDLIFVGQRGAGESNALHCIEEIGENPERAFDGLFVPERVAECYEEARGHADPSYYTTEEYVADIHDVLEALAVRRVLLWGGSGGTRTALAYTRAHPEQVVAMALDGVAPLDFGMPAPFAEFSQAAWDRVVEDCANQPACAAAFPELDGSLQQILARLDQGPVSASITANNGESTTVEVSRGAFVYAIRGILYNAQQTANLPAQITRAAETGNLDAFAQAHYSRSATLRGGVLAMGLHLSIYCAEDLPLLDLEEARASTAGTFMGSYLIDQYAAACEAWPVDAKPASWYTPVEADLPVLVLSGWYDPSTPAAAGDHVARTLSGSRHVVVRNVGHGAGFNCARPVVERFLVEGGFDNFENPCGDQPIQFVTE